MGGEDDADNHADQQQGKVNCRAIFGEGLMVHVGTLVIRGRGAADDGGPQHKSEDARSSASNNDLLRRVIVKTVEKNFDLAVIFSTSAGE